MIVKRLVAGSDGGADGIRTHDLLDAIEARSQLRHGPTEGEKRLIVYSIRSASASNDGVLCRKIESSSGLFLPRAEDRANDDHANEAVAIIDQEEMKRPAFEFVGGKRRRANEPDPEQNAERCALRRGVHMAPEANVGKNVGENKSRDKRDDVGDGRIHLLSLGKGHSFECHPGFAKEYAIPESAKKPVDDGRNNDCGVIDPHISFAPYRGMPWCCGSVA